MKTHLIFVIVIMNFVCVFALPNDLPNLHQPRPEILTAGQPNNNGYAQLQAMGVATVINVLPEKECDPGEESMVIVNNMVYFKLPFDPENLQFESVQEFEKLVKYVEKPLLIHCSTGNHVGGLWLSYRVLIEKASILTALQEARIIGMQPEMEVTVVRWLVGVD